jgi:hypothetical protein
MAARVFKVEFRIAVAQRILNGESVFAEQSVQDQAQRSLSLARFSRRGQDHFETFRCLTPQGKTAHVS